MIIKNNDWIKDLKVGDKVNVRWGSIYVVREVTRITATQIIFVTPNGAILKFTKQLAKKSRRKRSPIIVIGFPLLRANR